MDDTKGLENNSTIKYYEENANHFIESTINADVSELYRQFENVVPLGGKILDLGCGSGRDSSYFVKRGYDVVAMDPSVAMCKQTRSLVNIPVYNLKAEEITFVNEFDAVWACASLLHIPRDQQYDTLILISKALKDNGILYCSWKYGCGDRVIDGRLFTDYTKKTIRELLSRLQVFEEMRVWLTNDVRMDRKNQKWINALLKKRKGEVCV